MGVIGTILAFVLVLVILVLVHELGHFVVAKLAGITVEEFGIGFPPRLASVMWHGTRYSINAVPLGGFVKMLGEDGEGDAERMRQRGLSPAAVERAMAGTFNGEPARPRPRTRRVRLGLARGRRSANREQPGAGGRDRVGHHHPHGSRDPWRPGEYGRRPSGPDPQHRGGTGANRHRAGDRGGPATA